MRFLRTSHEKRIDCVLIFTCCKVENCHVLGNDLSSGKQNNKKFSRNLTEVSICLNEY